MILPFCSDRTTDLRSGSALATRIAFRAWPRFAGVSIGLVQLIIESKFGYLASRLTEPAVTTLGDRVKSPDEFGEYYGE